MYPAALSNSRTRGSSAARGAALGAVASSAAFVTWAMVQHAKRGVKTQWGPLDAFAVLMAAAPGAALGAALGAVTHRA
jgi:hypothetical protein